MGVECGPQHDPEATQRPLTLHCAKAGVRDATGQQPLGAVGCARDSRDRCEAGVSRLVGKNPQVTAQPGQFPAVGAGAASS